jgi:hypothetical protein
MNKNWTESEIGLLIWFGLLKGYAYMSSWNWIRCLDLSHIKYFKSPYFLRTKSVLGYVAKYVSKKESFWVKAGGITNVHIGVCIVKHLH